MVGKRQMQRRGYPFRRHHPLNAAVVAICLIVVGGMMLGHNLKWIGDGVYRVVISWQMLCIVLGIAALMKRFLLGGIALIAFGVYCLMPQLGGIDRERLWAFWPVLLIAVGLFILLKRKSKRVPHWEGNDDSGVFLKGKHDIVDGFITVDISFGNVRQAVLDSVFRGGYIDVSFGSVFLDLRRTSLAAAETVLRVDLSFGGAELTVPAHWNVVIETEATLGGSEDRRSLATDIDNEHKLIIRGNILFSGLQVKS